MQIKRAFKRHLKIDSYIQHDTTKYFSISVNVFIFTYCCRFNINKYTFIEEYFVMSCHAVSCNTNQHLRSSNLHKRLLNAFFYGTYICICRYMFFKYVYSRPKFPSRKLEIQVLILNVCHISITVHFIKNSISIDQRDIQVSQLSQYPVANVYFTKNIHHVCCTRESRFC